MHSSLRIRLKKIAFQGVFVFLMKQIALLVEQLENCYPYNEKPRILSFQCLLYKVFVMIYLGSLFYF